MHRKTKRKHLYNVKNIKYHYNTQKMVLQIQIYNFTKYIKIKD